MSQGYLKLYVDGRLTTPDDQKRALQQTREALGVIAVLCADISKVSALADAGAPVLLDRLDAAALAGLLGGAAELEGATWLTAPASAGRLATNAPNDLVRAMAVMLKSACDEDKAAPRVLDMQEHDGALVLRGGSATAVAALPAGPGAAGAVPSDVERGGRGLTLIWALFILDQHGIQTWRHQDHKASVGFRIPLVTV